MKKKRDWKSKVHPEFIWAAQIHRLAVRKLTALGPDPPSEGVQRITAWFKREKTKALKKFRRPARVSDDVVLVSPLGTPDEGFMQWMHWTRCREPLWQTVLKADMGDIRAQEALNRTVLDYQHARRGEKLAAPKGNYTHSALLWIGWHYGLRELTSEELADCFDELCPCKVAHGADALKKLRARFVKDIRKAKEWQDAMRAQLKRKRKTGRSSLKPCRV